MFSEQELVGTFNGGYQFYKAKCPYCDFYYQSADKNVNKRAIEVHLEMFCNGKKKEVKDK